MRDLNRRHPHAARARVDENAFALAQSRHVSQRVPRSHENDRQRRRFLEGKVCRNAPHVCAARQRLRGDSEYGEAKNAISRCDVSHARSNLPNDTSHFIAENARVRRIAGIKRERFEHVAKIHARRFDVDQHLAGTTRRQLKRSKTKGIKMPTLTGLETQRQRGIKPLLARGPAAIQSLGIARFAAEGDLALRGFAKQLAPKQRHVRGGGFEGKIDAAEEKFGVFVRE